jgi:hypothetical protein
MISTAATTTTSPDQRLGEIAAILAAAVLRLRGRTPIEPTAPIRDPIFPILTESAAQGLEVPANTVLTVRHVG